MLSQGKTSDARPQATRAQTAECGVSSLGKAAFLARVRLCLRHVCRARQPLYASMDFSLPSALLNDARLRRLQTNLPSASSRGILEEIDVFVAPPTR